ncbi:MULTISPECIES: hypothetical protein [Oerskovia]|uniref:HK97 gp10 family phage protein n=1 Tax=Oerskovia merdavium TaxID=2762227 RepID=A0ABR8U447_9CELL|nr:hypothetical protein [Oerskovia merdavium]MBD7982801.1 hypothetical protein [Oerskovia merdavium]
MDTFTSAEHPRANDGKFTTKPVDEASGGLSALGASTPSGVDALTRRQFSAPRQSVYGFTEWVTKDGTLHRTNGPAVEHEDGAETWMVHGKTVVGRNARGGETWYMDHPQLGFREATREDAVEAAREVGNANILWAIEAYDDMHPASDSDEKGQTS